MPPWAASFVVITHLGPQRETLLARDPRAPDVHGGRQAADGIAVNPITCTFAVERRTDHERQQLVLRSVNGSHHERNPIDVSSPRWPGLRENAVGIVLSGGGSDGTLGIKGIKEEGGLTIAQGIDGAGPGHDGMPNSAIATGLVDLVVPVEDMGASCRNTPAASRSLQALVRRRRDPRAQDRCAALQGHLRRRCANASATTSKATRRRRSCVACSGACRCCRCARSRNTPSACARIGDEAGLLFRDLLIGVTSFFRDSRGVRGARGQGHPEAVRERRRRGHGARLGARLRHRRGGIFARDPVARAHADAATSCRRVQVFATDIDEHGARGRARAAAIPQAMLEDVSPERLQRFFRAGSRVATCSRRRSATCASSPRTA